MPKVKTALAWSHFNYIDDKTKVQCLHCERVLLYHGGTTTMNRHLRERHKDLNLEFATRPSMRDMPIDKAEQMDHDNDEDGSIYIKTAPVQLSRNVRIRRPKEAALLVIDMQNYCATMGTEASGRVTNPEYFYSRVHNTCVPGIQNMQIAFRKKSAEVIFTVIEALTSDGRDQSLDYKISNLLVPKGSPAARVLPEISPTEDEIIIPKTSCSVFNSTNIDYVLRNLNIKQLVICGIVTNQCVESAVRDAADKGYLVSLVEDGCAAYSPTEHRNSLESLQGFCRVVSSRTIVTEMNKKR